MLLAIDVGNTETVIGLFVPRGARRRPAPARDRHRARRTTRAAGLRHHWRLSTVADRTPDEHALLLTQLLDLDGTRHRRPR